MMGIKKNRKHGIIDDLPQTLKDTVEQMLLANCRYADIVNFLQKHSIAISPASICRYARNYHANVERLKIAQENFKRMTDELDRYPNLDTTEAIIRLASQIVLDAMSRTPEEKVSEVEFDKLLREANGLIKAAAYKKNIETSVKDKSEAGLDAIKAMVFDAMSRERPDLYAEVSKFLNEKKAALESGPTGA